MGRKSYNAKDAITHKFNVGDLCLCCGKIVKVIELDYGFVPMKSGAKIGKHYPLYWISGYLKSIALANEEQLQLL
jgi:hypothetical protein